MKSRRWWYGAAWHWALLGMAANGAHATCPPGETDGAVVSKGDLVLAYRTVPAGKASRIPLAKHFALEVQLCDKAGISAARLQKADATMPEHKHGMNYRPVITRLDGGRFRVEGMMFHMAGRWELAFEVQTANEVTRFTHDVQID